jgi:Mg2+ and Co2+ transporter CorA
MSKSIVDGYKNYVDLSVDKFSETVLINKEVKSVPGDGNCFFHSIALLLNKQNPEKKTTHLEIRKAICEYYKNTFGNDQESVSDALSKLETGSDIEQRLFQLYTFGSNPESNGKFILKDYNIQHQYDICNEDVWGEESDVIVTCIIYKINIVVFSLLPPSKYNNKELYRILTYKNNNSSPTFLLKLKMDGNNSHYEPITDKAGYVSKIRSLTKKKDSPSGKGTTRKLSKKNKTLLDKLRSLLDKLTVYNEQIDKFIPSSNKDSLAKDFSDIQIDVVKMISELDSTHSKSSSTHSKSSSIHSKSSSTHSKSSEKKNDLTSQNKKIENEIASLTTMLEMVNNKEKSKIIKQIKELHQQLAK